MNSTSTNPTHPIPEVGDPRFDFAHVVKVTGDLIAATEPADFSKPTPCAEYDVEMLTAHMVAVLQRVSAVARGEDPFSVPQEIERPTDGDYHAAWMAAAHDVQRDWADPAVLERALTLPFGVLPGALAITIYSGEFATHAWDLAHATGRDVVFDDDRLTASLEAMQIGIPAEGRNEEMPFDPVVEVDATAPVAQQMAGWTGRRAAASPA